jgi:hypothetical protein
MGMDVYGLNPKIKEGSVKPKIDWNTATEKEKDDYFKQMDKFEEENKGYYFRNNVWWWRPLANYIIEFTGCVEEEHVDYWHENSGFKVNETVAREIAKQLKHLIKVGHTKMYAEQHMADYKKAEAHNKKVEEEAQKFHQEMVKKHGMGIAPRDYPKEDYEKWNVIQNKKDWTGDYPFNIKNVQEFAEFAEESGGFKIC